MSDILKQLLLQLILIVLNAFFAATEIAVISLNEKKVKSRAESGDKKAAKMLKMIEQPTRFLSTIQIGITLAGFLGSAFAADNFAERLSGFVSAKFNLSSSYAGAVNTAAVVVITLILSYFTLVLGELVPKRIAMRNKEKLAEYVCGVISVLACVLKPIIWLLTASTNVVLRLFGIDPNAKEDPVSEEDIVLMLDAGADEGSLNQNDIEYIKNVFKLDRLTAEDVMTPKKAVVSILSDASDDEIMKTITEEGYSRIHVYSESSDSIIGILYTRDYLLKRSQPGFTLESAMHQPVFVPESIHIDTLLKSMQTEHNHIVVVVNEYGETSGIVTIEDILEELVGEIWDELDEAVENIVKTKDNTYSVLCTAPIEEFFEFFGLEPDEETEATTVNGWLTELCGNIPDEGQKIEYKNLSITVTHANDTMALEISVAVNGAEPGQNNSENSL